MKFTCLLLAFGLWVLSQSLHIPNRSLAGSSIKSECDLSFNSFPRCWVPRKTNSLNILLLHYGSEMNQEALAEIGRLYQERFALASQSTVTINLVSSLVMPLKEMPRDLEFVKTKIGGNDEAKKGIQRLKRLWYYYQNISIGDEIYNELLKVPEQKNILKDVDAVVVLSSPQIDGLAYLSGAFSLIEYPSEIAWKLSDGGDTDYENKYRLVDRMIHETGHLLGIDHPSDQCDTQDLTAWAKCCKESPGGQDVMSYCRPRSSVSENLYFKFTQCTLDYMTNVSLPSMLNGTSRTFQQQNCL